jgi:uncharacterized protein YbgA (DUF1722 family)/uncharacterized protein YbbK (DUF523 family)
MSAARSQTERVDPASQPLDPIRLGISSCLLGNFVEWVPVCPEVEVGMGTPRPALRLVRDSEGVRMVEIKSRHDHTRSMNSWAARRVRSLRDLELSGYILKKDSPSCGMTRVKIYSDTAMPVREGEGLYASALMHAYPNLPVEDEGRLNDAKLRENFIERLFAYARLRRLFRGRWTARSVVQFHTAHKLQLMAHSTVAYRELGRLVATQKGAERKSFKSQYESAFMGALRTIASRGRNANMLQHAAGHLKDHIDSPCRTELSDIVHDYRKGLIPLVVPMTLIGHHARLHSVEYLNGQSFLAPHPRELMLRNHV